MDYEAVYLPKNHFIKEESMATDQYLALFYPFDQLDLVKNGIESSWKDVYKRQRTICALISLRTVIIKILLNLLDKKAKLARPLA